MYSSMLPAGPHKHSQAMLRQQRPTQELGDGVQVGSFAHAKLFNIIMHTCGVTRRDAFDIGLFEVC